MVKIRQDSHREPSLFPVVADVRREQRTVSIFISVFRLIPAFNQSILQALGVSTGTRTKVRCTVEPQLMSVLSKSEGEPNQPDAMIEVDTGRSTWTALVEAKIEDKPLKSDQVRAYIQLARERGYQALITISNDFVENPKITPVKSIGKIPKSISLLHLSWSAILTHALIIRDGNFLKDPVQEQVIEDFVGYLRNQRSGLRQFNRMSSEWKEVVQLSRAPNGLSRMKKNDARLLATVRSWHQEVRDISLQINSDSGYPIKPKLSKEHSNNPEKRIEHDVKVLIEKATLNAVFRSPESDYELNLSVVLTSGRISCGVWIQADDTHSTIKGRTSQLKHELSDIENTYWDQIEICGWYKGSKQPAKQSMSEFMKDPLSLGKDDMKKPPTSFEIIMAMDKPNRFDGPETFIKLLEKHVMQFYKAVWWKL